MSFSPDSRIFQVKITTEEANLDWADYLRDEAAKFRQLAETAEDPSIKQELLDLAAVCEEVANNIEDRMPDG